MGPFRRGLILALVPGPAFAQTCAQMRPGWTPGSPATAASELSALAINPITLVLIFATVLAARFRIAWAGLLVVLLWTVWVSILSFVSGPAIAAARAEGCIGSPALFIALVAGLCVALVLYTSPRDRQS